MTTDELASRLLSARHALVLQGETPVDAGLRVLAEMESEHQARQTFEEGPHGWVDVAEGVRATPLSEVRCNRLIHRRFCPLPVDHEGPCGKLGA